jgi:hypothetical protein
MSVGGTTDQKQKQTNKKSELFLELNIQMKD